MRKSALIFAVACAALLSACRRDAAPRPPGQPSYSSSVLIPFKVGESWSYVYSTYDSLGRKLSSRATRTVVSKDTLIGSEHWYALQDDAVREEGEPPSFATNRSDGVYLFGPNGEGSLLYKYPAVPGDRCPPFVVAAIDTTITSPAGTFRCYLYEDVSTYTPGPHRSFTVVTRDFVAPGTGLIRHEATTVWTDMESGVTIPGPTDVTEATAG